MKPLKLKGKLDIEVHANDFLFRVPTLGKEDLGNLLEDYQGVVVSITVKPLLSICPKCGSRMQHEGRMWNCTNYDFSYYEENDGTLGFV